ncbi:MAG TPA: hypothetical protein DCR71_02710, partial [Dehalococcoidia bacterium]|nr:hypothetical protein [Dehalococcoidia bacterium]
MCIFCGGNSPVILKTMTSIALWRSSILEEKKPVQEVGGGEGWGFILSTPLSSTSFLRYTQDRLHER